MRRCSWLGPMLAVACTALIVAACDDLAPLPTNSAVLTSTPADDLARAVAVALGDAAVRHSVLEAMRASPLRGHRLHLATYLASDDGDPLLRAAGAGTDRTVSAIWGMLAELPDLDLHVPSYFDRIAWTGTARSPRGGNTGRHVPS